MADGITVDRNTLKALGADARVSILKSLLGRRKTQAELASELSLKPPTVMEHLRALEGAGLIEKKEEGHKWKYFELTPKGRAVVSPSELKVWFVLGTMLLLTVAVAVFILPGWFTNGTGLAQSPNPESAPQVFSKQAPQTLEQLTSPAADSQASGAVAGAAPSNKLTIQSTFVDVNSTNSTNSTSSTNSTNGTISPSGSPG